jgi:apolipoprotein N-acyltransferase
MVFSIKKIPKRTQFAIISGFFIGTSYIPFPPWALFFCLVPLWLAWWEEEKAMKVFFYGWISQFLLTLIGFHWVFHTTVEFGHQHPVVGVLVLILFCCVAHLHIPLAGLFWHFTRKRLPLGPVSSWLLLILFSVLLERLYPMIFPWHLGYPWLWAKMPATHWADVVGFESLSALTIFINGLLFWAWRRKSEKVFAAKVVVGVLLGFGLLNVSGHYWGKRWPEGEKTFNVMIVQANIGNFEKYQASHRSGFQSKILNKYLSLNKKGFEQAENVDLVVWPETAFPSDLDTPFLFRPLQRQLISFIRTHQVPFFVGSFSLDMSTRDYFNGMFLFDERGIQLNSYRKSILLAFGEYFPGTDIIPGLEDLVESIIPEISHFSRGGGPKPMQLRDTVIGVQICYEGLFPWFSRGLAQKGVDIMFNVTNDSWFGGTFEHKQHLYMTLARTIEVRRPLVRSTNTGISTVILATGEILEQSPWAEEWVKTYKVKYTPFAPQTIFSTIQPYLPWFWLISILLIIGVSFLRRAKD